MLLRLVWFDVFSRDFNLPAGLGDQLSQLNTVNTRKTPIDHVAFLQQGSSGVAQTHFNTK